MTLNLCALGLNLLHPPISSPSQSPAYGTKSPHFSTLPQSSRHTQLALLKSETMLRPQLLPRSPTPRKVFTPALIGHKPIVQPPGPSLGLRALRQPGLESASENGTGGFGWGARSVWFAPPSLHKRLNPPGRRPQPVGSGVSSRWPSSGCGRGGSSDPLTQTQGCKKLTRHHERDRAHSGGPVRQPDRCQGGLTA